MATSEPSPSTATSMDTSPKASPVLKMEESRDRACRRPAAAVLSASFTDDPVLRWLTAPSSKAQPHLDNDSVRDSFFHNGILSMGLGSGSMVFNPDGQWNCAGILCPPKHNPESLRVYLRTGHRMLYVAMRLGWGATKKGLITHPKAQAFMKSQVFPPSSTNKPNPWLKNQQFYYLFFLGALPSARGQGLGSAMMRHIQVLATRDKVPVYFECSKESSRLFYERLGFKSVCVIRFGKGEVDEDGYGVGTVMGEGKEAVGARFWALVWWPDGMWPEGFEYWDGVKELEVK